MKCPGRWVKEAPRACSPAGGDASHTGEGISCSDILRSGIVVDSGCRAAMRTLVVINKWECLSVSVSGQRKPGSCRAGPGRMCMEGQHHLPEISVLFTIKYCTEGRKLSSNCSNPYVLNSLCILKCVLLLIQGSVPLVKLKLPQAKWQGKLMYNFLFSSCFLDFSECDPSYSILDFDLFAAVKGDVKEPAAGREQLRQERWRC